MGHGEAVICTFAGLRHRYPEQLGESDQCGHSRRIAPGAPDQDERIARVDELRCEFIDAMGLRRGHACDAELTEGWKPRAVCGCERDLARHA
jgi:hypothetical protein